MKFALFDRIIENTQTNKLLKAILILQKNVHSFKDTFDLYVAAKCGSDFPLIESIIIEEADKTQRSLVVISVLKDLNTCSVRIVNDTIRLSEAIRTHYHYNAETIKMCNDNLIDCLGTSRECNIRYNQLKARGLGDYLADIIQENVLKGFKELNETIISYNENFNPPLYTIKEIFQILDSYR